MRPIRFLLVTFVLALSALFGASTAAAQTALPPSLVGEGFEAFENSGLIVDRDRGEIEIESTCTPIAGSTFQITYTASGVAVGPYPGTFTETGTVTVLLTTQITSAFAYGVVTDWDVDFTIDSPVGQVTGTKSLGIGYPANCAGDRAGVSTNVDSDHASGDLTYEASIKTSAGTFTDEGRAFAIVQQFCIDPCEFEGEPFEAEYFAENFYLSTGVLPVDTSGKATGGGQVGSLSDPREGVTLGFNVRKDESETRLKGTCSVLDHATGTHVKCLTVTDYQQIANTATWEGTAEVNGVREHYRITVQDNGEPNQGLDTFSIKTETYEAAGNVQRGNVQLHKQALAL